VEGMAVGAPGWVVWGDPGTSGGGACKALQRARVLWAA